MMGDLDDNEDDVADDITGEKGGGLSHKKIGHRRVDSETGAVSYKKVPTSGLMVALQIGIGHSIGAITPQQSRDILMKDFSELEIIHFPADGSATTPAHRCKDFLFKTYAPRAFKKFRKEFGIEADNFLVSLCTDRLKELSNPGASGSLFFLSHDDNFIIKTIQSKEAIFLQKLLPGYYLNLTQNTRTTLPKFYGSFQYESMGKTIRICIMNNILPSNIKYHEKYDLKGSTHGRKAGTKERTKNSPTLKDCDFIDVHPGGLILEPDLYDDLRRTLERDVRVLESFRIMDYSLLLGVHNLTINKQETLKSRKPNLDTRPVSDQEGGYDRDYARQVLDRIGSQRQKETEVKIEQSQATPGPMYGGGVVQFVGVNERGEECLIYLGIIDILQSYILIKKMEHAFKSMYAVGDTVSVHKPGFYAKRFMDFCFNRVFKRGEETAEPLRRQRSQIKRTTSRSNYLSNSSVPSKSKSKASTQATPSSSVIEPIGDGAGPSTDHILSNNSHELESRTDLPSSRDNSLNRGESLPRDSLSRDSHDTYSRDTTSRGNSVPQEADTVENHVTSSRPGLKTVIV